MSNQIEALKEFFSAINSNDMQSITKHFDSNIVRIEPEGFKYAGTYRGIIDVKDHIIEGRSTWDEGSCKSEKFLENGDKVVVYLNAHVRIKGSTDWIGGKFADGFLFRDSKIIEYISFAERTDALKWADIAPEVKAQ